MEPPYSKREQDIFFKELFTRMDKQDSTLQRIEEFTSATKEQATKTNGRVSLLEAENKVLEDTVTTLNKTKDTVTRWGGAIALVCFLLGLAPFMYQLLKDSRRPQVTNETVSLFVEGIQKVLEEQATVEKQ